MSFLASQKSELDKRMSVAETQPLPVHEKEDDVELMSSGTECENIEI